MEVLTPTPNIAVRFHMTPLTLIKQSFCFFRWNVERSPQKWSPNCSHALESTKTVFLLMVKPSTSARKNSPSEPIRTSRRTGREVSELGNLTSEPWWRWGLLTSTITQINALPSVRVAIISLQKIHQLNTTRKSYSFDISSQIRFPATADDQVRQSWSLRTCSPTCPLALRPVPQPSSAIPRRKSSCLRVNRHLVSHDCPWFWNWLMIKV